MKFQGVSASESIDFNATQESKVSSQINKTIEWLADQNYDFAVLYDSEPDHSAHVMELNHPSMNQNLLTIDDQIGSNSKFTEFILIECIWRIC